MENIFKLLALGILLIFSFFYISETNNFLVNNNDLLKVIDNLKEDYKVSSVDAVVYEDFIIPGINGKSVNLLESYYKMNPYDIFSETFLVFDDVTPVVSLENYLDKYIEKGNPLYRNISIIIDENILIETFLIENSIFVNKLVTIDTYQESSFELINNEIENFEKLSALIENTICIVNAENESICKENSFYLVKPNTYVTNYNYIEIKNNLYSGQIIYIENNLDLLYFKSLYLEILFRGYDIVFLSELIKE